ncbi:hypothetical protein BH10CYA1_BH10CYA1_40410 [soil metagenome]
MTLGSGVGSDGADSKQIKSADSTGAPTKGDKPTRKVSKTIMEGAAPEAEPPAKLAKTIVELSRPDLAEVASASIAEDQDQSSDAQLAPRKVGKTMLELLLPTDFLAAKQGKKVPKTILDFDSLDASDVVKGLKSQVAVRVSKSLTEVTPPSTVSQVSDLDETAKRTESSELDTTVKVSAPEHGSERYVAKTMLDHQVLSSALEKSAEKKKIRAAELALERSNEPVKEFHQVDSKKMATPCSFTWSESSSKDRVRACSQCRTQVYDFTGMELDDAEALIFKQESVKKATLFKRADGKFMTKNCPLQAQRKRNLFLLCVIGALVILSAVAVLILMPPQPEPPEPTIVDQSKASTNSESKKTTPVQGVDGTFHYRAGEPEGVQPDSNPPTVSGTPAPTSSTTTTTTTTTTTSGGEYWDTSGAN